MKFLDTIRRFLPHAVDNSGEVVTRIAPSPTGKFHVGTARTALINYLYARAQGGRFLVRIEDTDVARSKREYETSIYDGLTWLGLEWDGYYRQSERETIYQRSLDELIRRGRAYRSREASTENPEKEVEVIRLRNPGREVTFTDMIRGDITFDTAELGDFVIARSMSKPLYHFAVVVDDHHMGVNTVIRGEEHISNTPRQILIQEALDIPRPRYAHLPLILNADRSKLSKRKGGATIEEYQRDGYLPTAFVNYLALLGWNPGDEQEFFTLDELIAVFDITKVQKGGAIFNREKLDWFNHAYLQKISDDDFLAGVMALLPQSITNAPGYDVRIIERLIPLLRERIDVFSDVIELEQNGELAYYFARPTPLEPHKLIWKGTTISMTRQHLRFCIEVLEGIAESVFDAHHTKEAVWEYATEAGRGSVLWPMRYALSGKERSPDPFVLSEVLGKTETLARLRQAHDALA